MTVARRWALRALALGLAAMLAACGSNTSDLQKFVTRVEARKAPPIKPMPTIPSYTPYTFRPQGRRSPFAPPAPSTPSGGNGVHPDLNRPLGPLEHFPLDALKMLGTLSSQGTMYALVQAPDGIVHLVKPGDHMGRHYGRVDAISPSGLTLTEIVPDGNGGYTKRGAALSPPQ